MKHKKIARIAEDCAYTFKGLHKTADSLHRQHFVLLFASVVFSIVSLGTHSYLSFSTINLILSILSICFTVLVLIKQSDFEKVEKYRELANQVKVLYDELEHVYHDEDITELEEILKRKKALMKKTSEYPVSILGRYFSKKYIEQEMDLDWIKKAKSVED